MAPLSGYRIVEVGDESGLFAGRLLADLGADVIRIHDFDDDESPEIRGVRPAAPFLDDIAHWGRSYAHLAFNAGKRLVSIDIALPEGRQQFLELLRTSHGLIEPGSLHLLGVSDAEIARANPDLVRVSITPFGLSGPWANWAGSDLIASAAGGLSFVSGEPERPPIHAAGDVCLKLASLAACTGMLAGLRGAPGAHIDISVQECAAFATLQTASPSYWRWHGVEVPRNTAFEFPVVRCRDDRWAVIRARPDQWPKLRAWAIGRGLTVRAGAGEWREATRTRLASFRLGEAADITEQLALLYDRDEFLVAGRENGLMGLPLMSFEDMRTNEHLVAIEEFVTMEHPDFGRLEVPKSPFAGMPSVNRAPTPPEPVTFEAARTPFAGPAPGTSAIRARPLDGLRVLEISWVLAGPLACQTLANLGAEVIKIESEYRMDTIRGSVPPPSGPTLTAGGWFNDANTGKRSATINTKTEEGRALLMDLAACCDIVVENMRPGALERMGLPYAELRARNPGAIVVHMAGAGRRGPWSGFGTFGNMITGASGLNVITGWEGSPPTGLGVAFGDFVSPYLAASAAIAAVIERERTGVGQEIDMAQLPGMISLMSAEWMRFARTGVQEPRRMNRDPNFAPHGIYRCAGEDVWIAIAVPDDGAFRVLASVIGREDLAADPRFIAHEDRKANEDALDAIISEWTRTQDRWEAAERLQAAGIPAAAVESIADQLDRDPQLGPRFEIVHQPTDPGLDITVHGEQIRFVGRENPVGRAPALGEHNEYVFREVVGLSEERYLELLASGAIR